MIFEDFSNLNDSMILSGHLNKKRGWLHPHCLETTTHLPIFQQIAQHWYF